MSTEELAAKLYTRYCTAVGGKAFNGDALPSAEEFFSDPKKQLQSSAWLATAAEATEQSYQGCVGTSPVMRAKLRIGTIKRFVASNDSVVCENLELHGVSKSEGYPEDGSDEDNTFARFTPSADLKISIQNPALVGKFKEGDTFYLDFTPVE